MAATDSSPDSSIDTSPRERLLAAADDLMHERGYEAVGVAELCKVAEVKKGSFYYFFDSKQDLAREMLDRSWRRTRGTIFAQSLDNPALHGVAAVAAYGDLLAENLHRIERDRGSVPGCRFGNFAVEMSVRDDAIRSNIGTIFDAMTASVAGAIRRGIDAGTIDAHIDVEQAAADIIAHMEGLMVLAKSQRNPELLRGLVRTAERILR